MNRTQLQTKYFKTKTQKDYTSFKKQKLSSKRFKRKEAKMLTHKTSLIPLNFGKML